LVLTGLHEVMPSVHLALDRRAGLWRGQQRARIDVRPLCADDCRPKSDREEREGWEHEAHGRILRKVDRDTLDGSRGGEQAAATAAPLALVGIIEA
jgi:hypothetical protein